MRLTRPRRDILRKSAAWVEKRLRLKSGLRKLRVAFGAAPLYQQSYYAYVVDAIRGALAGRAIAAMCAAVLLAPPIALIAAGASLFGSAAAFAIGALSTAIALELRGSRTRGRRLPPTETFIAPVGRILPRTTLLFAEIALPPALAGWNPTGDRLSGFLWGGALAGVQDALRQLLAVWLAYRFGQPLYERAFRWIDDPWEIKRTFPLLKLLLSDIAAEAYDFAAWAPKVGASFVAVEWQGDEEWNERAILAFDGNAVWVGNDRLAIPLASLGGSHASATPVLRNPFVVDRRSRARASAGDSAAALADASHARRRGVGTRKDG